MLLLVLAMVLAPSVAAGEQTIEPYFRINLTSAAMAPIQLAEITLPAQKRRGCVIAGGRWFPESTTLDRDAITGVGTFRVAPLLFVCRNGRWISPQTGEVLQF